MLRVILVVDPSGRAIPLVVSALTGMRLTAVFAPASMSPEALELARPLSVEVTPDDRLLDGRGAVDLIQDAAAGAEGAIVVVAPEEVVRGVVTHALDAPVPVGRLALDPGAIAEVEVRVDAPWTVNRINDICHLDHFEVPPRAGDQT